MPLIKPRRVSTAKRRTIGVCLSICLMLATTEFRRGPNPYPQNEGDWPGVGVISPLPTDSLPLVSKIYLATKCA